MKVNCDSTYPVCLGGDEDELHLFFNCPKAPEIWAISGLQAEINLARLDAMNYHDCFFKLLSTLPNTSRSVFSMVFWAIWKVRNDKIWENLDTIAVAAMRRSKECLWDWEVARMKQNPNHLVLQQGVNNNVERWTKPRDGELKCNVDAAVFSQEGRYGIGMCIRNNM